MSHIVGMTITSTVVTLTAATDATVAAANPYRKYLAIVNIGGTNPATLNFNAAAVAGQGWLLSTNGTTKLEFASGVVPVGAVHAISTSGTTLVVLEGI